jgi:hypothetical protein
MCKFILTLRAIREHEVNQKRENNAHKSQNNKIVDKQYLTTITNLIKKRTIPEPK